MVQRFAEEHITEETLATLLYSYEPQSLNVNTVFAAPHTSEASWSRHPDKTRKNDNNLQSRR